MKSSRKNIRPWKIVLAAALIAVVGFCAVNHSLIAVIFHNLYDPQEKLSGEQWENGKSYMGVSYSEVSETDYLNLYVPDSSEPVPLIIVIHGGGFVKNDCESRQAKLFYSYFRDNGYACATVNYRLAQEASFPGAICDVKAAIRFLRSNAEKYGINPDKIAVWGESAGGYLAVMAGVTNDDEFDSVKFTGEENIKTPVSADVSAIIDFYGAVNLESTAERKAEYKKLGIPGIVIDMSRGWLDDVMKDYPQFDSVEDFWVGKCFSAMTPEERFTYQPAYYIEKNAAEISGKNVYICHGYSDLSVPWTQSAAIKSDFENAGAWVTAEFIPDCKHAGEKIYTPSNLEKVKRWLDGVFGE